MAAKPETVVVYLAGTVQGIVLVTFPAASTAAAAMGLLSLAITRRPAPRATAEVSAA